MVPVFYLEVKLQTTDEKADALRTVLPLLHAHHPGTKSCISYERKPDPTPTRTDPCAGRDCPGCTDRCPDEGWERIRRYYATRYRTFEIRDALDVLGDHSPAVAQSVYYEYVEPWPEFSPAKRKKFSEAGLHFLAAYIPGDIPFHSLDPIHEPWRYEARKLHKQGLPIRLICKRIGRAYVSVRAAIHNCSIIDGRLRGHR